VDDDDDDDFGVWELAPTVEGGVPFGSTLWKFAMDRIYRPIYMNLLVNKGEEEKQRRFDDIVRILCGSCNNDDDTDDDSVWDIRTVIPCHGDILRGKTFIRNILRSHFNLDR